jgi:antitoxin component YwqK of YwqJK toxin-antitoxin module
MDIIGYHKHKHYIITIHIHEILSERDKYIKYNETAKHYTSIFTVINIEDINGKSYDIINTNKTYINGETYFDRISYYLVKDIAYCQNFIKDNQFKLLNNLFCGIITEYYSDGRKRSECFYVNNQKNGNYKEYHDEHYFLKNIRVHDIYIDATYVNNKLHGEYKIYYENGNIKEESQYEYGMRYGIHKIYDENNRKLIFEYEYKNGVIINMKKK